MFDILILLILVGCGLIFWKINEKKHYTSIVKREETFKKINVISDKDLQNLSLEQTDQEFFSAGTVIAIDYFKKLMAWFVNFFWGRMKSYESLVDRARREAVLRLKEKASKKWYNTLINLRIETSSISKWKKWNIWSVEALAYASWVKIKNEVSE